MALENPFVTPYPFEYRHADEQHRQWLTWWLDQMGVVSARDRGVFYREMEGRKVPYFNVLARRWQESRGAR